MKITPVVRDPFHGDRCSLLVLSRDEVGYRIIPEPHLLISIHSPGDPPARLPDNPSRVAALFLEFHDECRPRAGITCMSPQDGRRVVEFIQAHPETRYVVVNCHAGISRSAGVAAGISEWLNGESLFFYERFAPNGWCRQRVLQAAPRWECEQAWARKRMRPEQVPECP